MAQANGGSGTYLYDKAQYEGQPIGGDGSRIGNSEKYELGNN